MLRIKNYEPTTFHISALEKQRLKKLTVYPALEMLSELMEPGPKLSQAKYHNAAVSY